MLSFFCSLLPNIQAAKLDISSDVQMKMISYNNLDFQPSASAGSKKFITQNALLGFAVKGIKLERTKDSFIDIAVSLNAVGVAGSTTAVKPPFEQIASRYPNTAFYPFIQQAYVKLYHTLLEKDVIMTIGRQAFRLGNGLLLSDDGLGFTGARIEIPALWSSMKGEIFSFEPISSQGQNSAGSANVYGASLGLPLEGLWQAYTVFENDYNTKQTLSMPVKKVFRQFSGVRYTINYNYLEFDGEAVFQGGSAALSTPNSGNIKFGGSAFLMQAKWAQPLGTMGTGKVRMTVGRGSGDKAGTTKTDEAFFPRFGRRYEGIERSGFGSILGATLYDCLATSSTLSGLPGSASGIQIFGAGVTMPPYKGFIFDFDWYLLKADRVAGGDRNIGTEINIKAAYPMGDKLKIQLAWGIFNPSAVYYSKSKAPSLLSIETTARF